MKQYILEKFSSSAFNQSAPFRVMATTPTHIHLQPQPVTYARHSPKPIPHHWKSTIKESLDHDVERDIIKPIDNNTLVEWCSSMKITMKKDGTPRCTIDLQKLNSQTAKETHHCESPFQLASQIPPHTKKTVIDAVDGCHAIPLDEASQILTIFITE